MIYWVWLNNLPGIGPHTQRLLLEQFNTPENIYSASQSELENCGLSKNRINTILENKNLSSADNILFDCKRKGISVMNVSLETFPDRLRLNDDMPVLIYYKGKMFNPEKTAGIVGPRKCTQETKEKVIAITKRCVLSGETIVSGMAIGVDGYAHTAAIKNLGRTIAVVANGLDICFPKAHDTLFEEIQQAGFVMSEYPPGTPALAYHFPRRNSIIAAMSDSLYVINPGRNSGSLITAQFAEKYSKPVKMIDVY